MQHANLRAAILSGARRRRSTGTRLRGGTRWRPRQAAGVLHAQHGERGGVPPGLSRATQQAFLEAHEHAFAYFGGVHRILRYDNLASAVRKVLRGHRREETVRFIAFRSHWRFEAHCTPAAGHEKGGSRARSATSGATTGSRPPGGGPGGASIGCCSRHAGRTSSACSTAATDRWRGDGDRASSPAAGGRKASTWPSRPSRVPPAAASRSAPTPIRCRCGRHQGAGQPAGGPSEVWHGGRCVARHERRHSRRQQILDLDHYLDVLERKPGAMAGCKPLEQWRRRPLAGRYDVLWQRLNERHGRQDGTRAMVQVILLGRQFGHDRLHGGD